MKKELCSFNDVFILQVDGSFCENLKIGGAGAYLEKSNKVKSTFSKALVGIPFVNRHEEHAIIESLKWCLKSGIRQIIVKTDSLYAVGLFSGQKKPITEEDDFFLLSFLMIKQMFDFIDIEFTHRDSKEDLAHKLSRKYLESMQDNKVFTIQSKFDLLEDLSYLLINFKRKVALVA